MSKRKITAAAAVAACAALVVSAGIFGATRGKLNSAVVDNVEPALTEPALTEPVLTEPVLPEQVLPEQSEPNVVEVERSYNERIADGEDVRIETHINERIEHQNFAFTLKDITVSQTFPEGITKDDIAHTPPVLAYTDTGDANQVGEDGYTRIGYIEEGYDYSEYAAEHGLPPIETEEGYGTEYGYTMRALDVYDVIDDNGLYCGPMDVPDESYRWIFLELEIENLSDEKQLEYMADMDLCGGDFIVHPITAVAIIDGGPQLGPASYSYYSYRTTVCYMSEHTEEEYYEGQSNVTKFHNLEFEPNETKTMVLGYCVSDHFVYGDLFLELHNSVRFTPSDDFVYLPLK